MPRDAAMMNRNWSGKYENINTVAGTFRLPIPFGRAGEKRQWKMEVQEELDYLNDSEKAS